MIVHWIVLLTVAIRCRCFGLFRIGRIHLAIDRERFVVAPACGAMIDDDVADGIPESVSFAVADIGDAPAEAGVANHDVVVRM